METYDEMKTGSHTLSPPPPTMIEHRIISCHRSVYAALYIQEPINPNSTTGRLDKVFHKGGMTSKLCAFTPQGISVASKHDAEDNFCK